MGTPCANGGLRSAPESQLGPAAAPAGAGGAFPSFFLKQLCVCHSCDLRDLSGPRILGLSINQVPFIAQPSACVRARLCFAGSAGSELGSLWSTRLKEVKRRRDSHHCRGPENFAEEPVILKMSRSIYNLDGCHRPLMNGSLCRRTHSAYWGSACVCSFMGLCAVGVDLTSQLPGVRGRRLCRGGAAVT